MILWLVILVLTVAVSAAALMPMLRPQHEVSELDHAVAFYEARKAELIRQLQAGQISQAECDAAEAEQARRVLAISKHATPHSAAGTSQTRRKQVAALTLILVPLLSLGVYLKLGKPMIPDQPLASRSAEPRNLDIGSALSKIEAHLTKNPNDGRGYEVVAPVYLRSGRYDDAVMAYRRIVELLGEDAVRLADLGESLVAQANGVVNAEARSAFERSITLDPSYSKSAFYLALAQEQDGDAKGALEKLRALAASMSDSPGRMRVQAEIDRLAPGEPSVNGSASPAGDGIAALPPVEREAAIRTMVDGLDQRLNQNGGSLEEWLQLARAQAVLQKKDRAMLALEAARKAYGQDPAAVKQIEVLARSIDIPSQSSNP